MERLDMYDELPQAMRRYLSSYGWHFSKGLFEWSVKQMKDRNGQKLQRTDKDAVEAQLRSAGVSIKNNVHYDAAYVWNMAMSDYYGSSLKDMGAVALFVRDYLDDPDGTKTRALDEFVGKCIGAGCHIDWEAAL